MAKLRWLTLTWILGLGLGLGCAPPPCPPPPASPITWENVYTNEDQRCVSEWIRECNEGSPE